METLGKSREPQSHLEAVYFLTPSAESVSRLCDDWANPPKSAGKKSPATEASAMYLKAHVFFSSPPSAQLAAIKKCKPLVVPRDPRRTQPGVSDHGPAHVRDGAGVRARGLFRGQVAAG